MTVITKVGWTQQTQEKAVVLSIGAQSNRSWIIHPVVITRVIRALAQRPKRWFVGRQAWFGRTIAISQSGRAFEALASCTKARGHIPVPVGADFNPVIGNHGTIMIEYTASRVTTGWFRNMFVKMLAVLPGGSTSLIAAKGGRTSIAGGMDRLVGDQIPELNAPGRNAGSDIFFSRARAQTGSHR